jgi:hypothetical protein
MITRRQLRHGTDDVNIANLADVIVSFVFIYSLLFIYFAGLLAINLFHHLHPLPILLLEDGWGGVIIVMRDTIVELYNLEIV